MTVAGVGDVVAPVRPSNLPIKLAVACGSCSLSAGR
jgi:hypothetical protein